MQVDPLNGLFYKSNLRKPKNIFILTACGGEGYKKFMAAAPHYEIVIGTSYNIESFRFNIECY